MKHIANLCTRAQRKPAQNNALFPIYDDECATRGPPVRAVYWQIGKTVGRTGAKQTAMQYKYTDKI